MVHHRRHPRPADPPGHAPANRPRPHPRPPLTHRLTSAIPPAWPRRPPRGPLPAGRSGTDMPGQQTCAPPVIVTLPAHINAATAEQAAGQISAAFTPGVTVVIADLTATACRDRSAIRHLLSAHRKAAARGGQVRFVIRPGGPLHRITEFAGTHPLLAVYPTLQRAIKADYPKHPAIAPRPGGHHHRIAI